MELARTAMEGGRIALGERIYDVSMFRACEQCGCCSSACPMTGVEDFNIRRVLRHIELGLTDEVTDSPLPWLCTTCGRCEDACPNGIEILDIVRILRRMSPAQWVPEAPACVLACPANIDIPRYVKLIGEGKVDEAYGVIRESVPFPGILGRVCTRPCEAACRRGDVFNQPVAICALKRYAADNTKEALEKAPDVAADTGHKVAIVGAGPAGLTAAFYLRKKGHQVTVFEERSEPGGMMRFGIPDYRLPRDVVEREVKEVLDTGIKLETKKKLGRDFYLDQLKEQGFEAVFLAIGAQLSRRIDIDGGTLDDVYWGVDFLYEVNVGKEISLKDRVMVIGGGNVAIDVALTASRLGAKEVTLASLEGREEMPANQWEIEEAVEEGVKIMPSWGPKRILEAGGTVSGVELVRCTSVFDAEGNFRPTFADITEVVEVDQVILAIGQAPDCSFIDQNGPMRLEKGMIVVDQETQETHLKGVFAGGDVAKVPGTIIDAIATGRRAAHSIDRALGGEGLGDEILVEEPPAEPYTGERERGFADLKRVEMPRLPVSERRESFSEVELGLTQEQAVQEAQRCLHCDQELGLVKEAQVHEDG